MATDESGRGRLRKENRRADEQSSDPGRRTGDGEAPSGREAAPTERLPGRELLLPAGSERTPTLSVVMPTLDEEDGIAECIDRITRALEELQVYGEVIVSDSSTDRTPEIAAEHGAIVVTPDRPGYGYAYRYGFEHARGEYVAIGDADTTYDFTELPALYRLVAEGDADMAMGSRLEGEIKPGAMPKLHQYVGNPLLTKFLNVFYGAGVSDAHSGFRVLRRSTLEGLNLRTDGMEFASEMVMEAATRDFEIAEMPITYHEREGEATLESFRDGWRHVRFMLVNAPGYLFSVPGVLLAAAGALVVGLSLTGAEPFGARFGIRSVVAGCLAVLVGNQVFGLGVFTAVAGDPIRTPEDPLTRAVVERVGLEQGALAGLFVFAAGAAYLLALTVRWVNWGFASLPPPALDVVALGATVLGLQVVFSAFFLSAVGDDEL
jgi:glycosyltransferase involved in cell wall biosynthesis